jgi:hypothetical protein
LGVDEIGVITDIFSDVEEPTKVALATAGAVLYVRHTRKLKADGALASVPYLQYKLDLPLKDIGTLTDPRFREGVHYYVEAGWVVFRDPIPYDSTNYERLWAEVALYRNEDTLEGNFGAMVGLPKKAFNEGALDISYLSAVKGLMFVLFRGPTMTNVRIGSQIFCNLPFAEEAGTVVEIKPDYSIATATGRILIQDAVRTRVYYYPTSKSIEINSLTGLPLAVGDPVRQFQPLCTGTSVIDYKTSPGWYRGYSWKDKATDAYSPIYEIQKYHLFQVRVDADVLNAATADLLTQFTKVIKPAHTEVIVTSVKVIADELSFTEDLSSRMTYSIVDNRYECEDRPVGWVETYSVHKVLRIASDRWAHMGSFVEYELGDKLVFLPPSQNAFYEYTITNVGTDGPTGDGVIRLSGVLAEETHSEFMVPAKPYPEFTSSYAHNYDDASGDGDFHTEAGLRQHIMVNRSDYSVGSLDEVPDFAEISGPGAVLTKLETAYRAFAVGNPLSYMFDHVDLWTGRQKMYGDRVEDYGPECRPDSRICMDFPEGTEYAAVIWEDENATVAVDIVTLADASSKEYKPDNIELGCRVFVGVGGSEEVFTVIQLDVGGDPNVIQLSGIPTAQGTPVWVQVLQALDAPRDWFIDSYRGIVPEGIFPSDASIFTFDHVQLGTSGVPADVSGPAWVTSVFMDCVPDFTTGFFVWTDMKVVEPNEGETIYVGGPTTFGLTTNESRYTVVSGVTACAVTSMSDSRNPNESSVKYPTPIVV